MPSSRSSGGRASSLRRGWGGQDLPAGPCHPSTTSTLHFPGLSPSISTPRLISPGSFLPHSPAFPAAQGEHLPANGRGRRAREGDGERASAAPGADGASRPRVGTKGKPPARGPLAGGARTAASPSGAARSPGAAGASPRGSGFGARRSPPARGRQSQVPAASAPHPARPGAPSACPRTHRAEAEGGGCAPGTGTRLQAPCPLSAAAARPRSSARCPGPSRPGSRRGASPAAAAASAAASAPPSRPPSVPPAGCGGRRDGLHQPRLYSGPWAAGRGRECGTGRAASSRRQRGTERKGRRGQGRRGVWIRRFTPTDLHLPRRISRPPPAAPRGPLPAGTAPAPQQRP